MYLDPRSVSILDEFGKDMDISRSELIRIFVDQAAQNLGKLFAATKTPPRQKYILDSLVGMVKLKGHKTTNLAQNIDEIYLSD